MADEELQLPLEIPWKLASTSQPLKQGGPDETTISLFFHEPDDESLTSTHADEKLVYVKVIASVSPCAFDPVDSGLASALLAGNLPVLHLLLDLKVTPASGETGGIRPYFHAAAPLHRRTIETGIVGDAIIEGASDGQFFGKSGSHLYESLNSTSGTTSRSSGASLGIPLIVSLSGSARTSTTDVVSDRSVDQFVDTTTRQASQERRELVSHTTKVENVLTLLSAKHLGTPYLRFSLSPRPLQLLSIDPSDPNLWFSQLLRQRSSGIEGIQEFTAVVVVPKGQEFCVSARLRRVCLLDDPPAPPDFNERLISDQLQLARMIHYLYGVYPRGTPLDELDIDIVDLLDEGEKDGVKNFRRPVVEYWSFGPSQIIEAVVVSPGITTGQARRLSINYKHFLEIWLETLRAEYEEELARSPLERGAILGEIRTLNTCFAINAEGKFTVSNSSSSTVPLVPVDFDPGLDVPPNNDVGTLVSSVRSRALQTITKWNTLDQKLNSFLSNLPELPEGSVRLDDPRIANVLIGRWAKLARSDSRNLGLQKAAGMLRLSTQHIHLLEQAGVKDLRGIALALNAAPEIALQNKETQRLRDELEGDKEKCLTRNRVVILPPDPIEFSISTADAKEIRRAITAALQAGASSPSSPSYPKPKSKRRK